MPITTEGNADLIPDAGKMTMDEGQMWGKGLIADFKRTVGTHWVREMTNFNQKTIAVTLLVFISVIAPTLTFGAVYGKGALGSSSGYLYKSPKSFFFFASQSIVSLPFFSFSICRSYGKLYWSD